MRIIGGDARGRRLIAPSGMDTRPTADKTRESLFNILVRDIWDAKVLDLFGGTGALALEAISRGASNAVICDVTAAAIKAINQNVAAVVRDSSRVRVIKADYRSALKQIENERFDLIFLDPPYKMAEAYAFCTEYLLNNDMLSDDAIIVCERLANVKLNYPEALEIYKSRDYRDTAIDFLRRAGAGEEAQE